MLNLLWMDGRMAIRQHHADIDSATSFSSSRAGRCAARTVEPSCSLLAVVLEGFGISRIGVVGIETELAPGPTLAQQVPTLIT